MTCAHRNCPSPPDPENRPDSVIEAPRRAHSQKPDIVYDLIETAYPDRTYLELFARSARDGWTSWGNEVVRARENAPPAKGGAA